MFHYQKIESAFGIEVVNHSDIGMAEVGESERFVAETLAGSVVSEGAWRQHFDRDIALQPQILCAIYFTHTSGNQFRRDAVMGNGLADQLTASVYTPNC